MPSESEFDAVVTTMGTTNLPRCPTLENVLDSLNDQYERLVLASHPRHVGPAADIPKGTLIVLSDWLLWQQMMAAGVPCIFYEAGLLDWDGDGFAVDLHIRCNDWVFNGRDDVTLFHGVSLGRQFARDASLVILDFKRLERSLTVLLQRFRPKEVVYHDYRTDLGVLDNGSRRELAKRITNAAGVSFVDRADSVDPADISSPYDSAAYAGTPDGGNNSLLLRAYEMGMDILSRLRRAIFRPQRFALIILGLKSSRVLIECYDRKVIAAQFPARRLPKRPKEILNYLRHGIYLLAMPSDMLSNEDRRAFDYIVARLEKGWAESTDLLETAIARRIQKHVLATGRFAQIARDILRIRKLLSRWKPGVVITDSVFSPPARIYLEAAQSLGIKTAHTWHSPWPHDLTCDLLGGDERETRTIDWHLGWGRASDRWLTNIGSKSKSARTGTVTWTTTRDAGHNRKTAEDRVLLLQYTPTITDIRGLNDRQFGFFVDATRMLAERGTKNIIFKLHPGIWSDQYYRDIAELFGIECEIIRHQPINELLEWANIVIGPAQTSVMQEALGAGLDYYAVVLPPTSMNLDYFDNVHPVSDVAKLGAALDNHTCADREAVLEEFCSKTSIPEPGAAIWKALSSCVGKR